LLGDIKDNGIREALSYVRYNGKNFIVDGHHRLKAARKLGLESVPAQEVQLPFLGYRTVDDLFVDMPR
jgi:ParB-like chromosome segregation protein Spo0J